LTQANVINGWQQWGDKAKDKAEQEVGFEKSLSQKE